MSRNTINNDPFKDDLDEAVKKKRWVPMGGFKVAFALMLVLVVGLPTFVIYMPQMMSKTPLQPSDMPRLEIYDSPEEDPRRIAWVGNHDFTTIMRSFVVDLRMPVQHGIFHNCSSLLLSMRNDRYIAHLYVLSPYTTANYAVDLFGNVHDATLLMNYTAADCAALIKEAHGSAKILCLIEGDIDRSMTAQDCMDEGTYVLTSDESIIEDTINTDLRMTRGEAVIRDLIELPLNPPDDLQGGDYPLPFD